MSIPRINHESLVKYPDFRVCGKHGMLERTAETAGTSGN